MKTKFSRLGSLLRALVLLGTLGAATTASAQTSQTYDDATGDIAPGLSTGSGTIDIVSVEVTVDGLEENISFKINLNGNPVTTDWAKYMIAIKNKSGGATTGNGWSRPINYSTGMNSWIGAWIDGPMGAEIWTYSGSWAQTSLASISKDTSSVTISAPVTSLGLLPGTEFTFDVYSSGGGGGDSAVDALSVTTPSVTTWAGPFTTTTPKTFVMPGTPAIPLEWLQTYFSQEQIDQRPAGPAADDADPDGDGLLNLGEYLAGTDPWKEDSDFDGLLDGVETGTGVFVNDTNTGSNPAAFDTDGDTAGDGDEVQGLFFGYISNPNVFNDFTMAAAGSFNTPVAWDPAGTSIPSNALTQVGDSLTTQYQWVLDYNFRAPATQYEFKFAANGSFVRNFGGTGGVAAINGPNIPAPTPGTGFYQFLLDTQAQTYSFSRKVFGTATAFLTAYGLQGDPQGDADGDGIANEDEYPANTDPTNEDTDGDGLTDDSDPEPLVPLSIVRDVTFSVNMLVQEANGNFSPQSDLVIVIGAFNDWSTSSGFITLTDPDEDGIYSGTSEFSGLTGASSGGYKFFNTRPGAPNGGYEDGDDRTFALGLIGQAQVLPTEWFSNNSTPPLPVITSNSSITSQVGVPFTYTTTVTPNPQVFPATYAVTGDLPAGLALDTSTGVISGTPSLVEQKVVSLVATNAAGASTPLELTINITSDAPSAFATWASDYGLNGVAAQPGSDPDADGFNNWAEFAFGTDPTRGNAGLTSGVRSGTNIVISWIQRSSGVAYTAQNLSSLVPGQGNWGTAAVSISDSPDQTGVPTGYVRRQFTVPISGQTFYRIVATGTP